ncbi:MAG: hypothetical protein Ct9H300mP4_04340 [Gammaproteobacteria bacterium]|nr:MAG: hypothetical protein Ct9H300mP4_04340 [Gammaproteobacteria bacterium]
MVPSSLDLCRPQPFHTYIQRPVTDPSDLRAAGDFIVRDFKIKHGELAGPKSVAETTARARPSGSPALKGL